MFSNDVLKNTSFFMHVRTMPLGFIYKKVSYRIRSK